MVKQAMREGAPEGLVVCAKVQTAGYGRRGHKWQSGEGSLYMSILLRPCALEQGTGLAFHGVPDGTSDPSPVPEPAASGQQASRMATLPLIVALAVRRAIVSFLPAWLAEEVKVKWPNDVVFVEATSEGFGKMCGISTEWKQGAVCVGIGVNVRRSAGCIRSERPLTPAEMPPRNHPTYMGDILGEAECPTVTQVRDAVLREFACVYGEWLAHGFSALRSEYMQRFALLGAEVRIDDAAVLDAGGSVVADGMLCCTVEGVTDDGMLVARPCGSAVLAKVASGTVTIGHFLENGEGLDHD